MFLGIVKSSIFTLLFVTGLQQLLTFTTWWFIQNVNLVFHEAGHVLFWFFGQFIFALGGTILEIAVPTIVTIMFMSQQSWFSAACTSWWCMTAWLSVSIYASDAQERLLPLITGDPASHDWHYLLTQLNLLQADDFIGSMFWFIALACLFFGLVLLVQDQHVRKMLRYRWS